MKKDDWNSKNNKNTHVHKSLLDKPEGYKEV